MKGILLVLTVLILSLEIGQAQTNVSGGIFANTTWSLANSPYIVVDTVVVFPGVTLTIQPGVVVKFNNKIQLEIRQARLIAIGTVTDSITFTSNSFSPIAGSWSSIILNKSLSSRFNYCNFLYAKEGISLAGQIGQDTLRMKNCTFANNIEGLYVYRGYIDSCNFVNNKKGISYFVTGDISFCKFYKNQVGMFVGGSVLHITNCTVNSNNTGIEGSSGVYVKNSVIDSNSIAGINFTQNYDSIVGCKIRYNGIGYFNSDMVSYTYDKNIIMKNIINNNNIGIKTNDWTDSIFCNSICNNINYDFYLNSSFGNNMVVANNYWCTPDSVSTELVIYDAHDNINKGIVYFMPIDSICSPNISLTISEVNPPIIYIYPNPFSLWATLQTDNSFYNATLTVFDCLGNVVKRMENVSGRSIALSKDNLSPGLYFLLVMQNNKTVSTKKLIIAD